MPELSWASAVAAVVLTLALYLWGLWVARRQPRPLFRLAARGSLLGVILALSGAAWALRQASHAQADAVATGGADAASRVASGISSAFAVAAIPIAVGDVILIASVVVLVLGTLRSPERGARHDP